MPPDLHEDEFFRAGTEGTYEGGPSSLIPVKLEDWTEAPDPMEAVRQIERRRVFQRFVMSIVATLALGVTLGATVRLGWGTASAASAPEPPRTPPAIAPPSPVTMPSPAVMALGAEPPSPAVMALGAEPPTVTEPRETHEDAEVAAPHERVVPAPVVHHAPAVRRSRHVSAPLSAHAHYEPPTATFPN